MLRRDGPLRISVVGIGEDRLGVAPDHLFGGPRRASLARVADATLANGPARIDLPVPQSVILFGLPGLARALSNISRPYRAAVSERL